MQEIEDLIIVLIIVFTTILFLMGVFFFVLINKYRRNLEKRQRESINNLILGQDNERERIARDLHDEMGPEIVNIIHSFDTLITNEPLIIETLEQAKLKLREAIVRIRYISHDLMSQSIHKFGLSDAIKEMIDRQVKNGIKFYFQSDCSGLEFSDINKLHLFRITQELMYNTQKHSQATEVHINLHLDSVRNVLTFLYSDNGLGNKESSGSSGIGIKNIRTRVDLMHGTVDINMDKGFKCSIMIHPK